MKGVRIDPEGHSTYLREMKEQHAIFDRAQIVRRRNRAAATAGRHEFLLASVAADLLERLSIVCRTFPVALNLGAHHGLLGRRLQALPGIQTVIDLEPAGGLIRQCSGLRVQAEEEVLPFRDRSLDLVVSALALHLVNDLPGTLVQIQRALKPDGLMLAALLGGDTLHQLRSALMSAETDIGGGASPRVAPFADVRTLGALLQRANFALPVADCYTVTVTYPDALALMRELGSMGATNPLCARHRAPLRRAILGGAIEHYARRYALPNGRVPATFEVITLTGWAPHESQQKPLTPGSARMRLAEVLGKGRS